MNFKPAGLSVFSQVVTWAAVVVFVVTLVMSFGSEFWPRITCLIFGVALLGCWLFSVKAYTVNGGAIRVQHPLWSASFEVRGLASENRHPGRESIRLFASNWIFGHTLGLCYSSKVGRFLVYVTDPRYRLDLETGRGVLVISPSDREGLSSALSASSKA
jgi:hypothetical protein